MSRSWIILACIFSVLRMQAECRSYHVSDRRLTRHQARAWCREHHADLVTHQNQEEKDHLKTLRPTNWWYWLGIPKINDQWVNVATGEPVRNEDMNWETGEPRGRGDCVVASKPTTRWYDAQCSSRHDVACSAASCPNDYCVNGNCVETVPGHKCQCFAGFDGDQCQDAVECSQLTPPPKGDFSCTGKYGDFALDSLCRYSCEVGYQLSHSDPLRCTASKNWSHSPPTCEVVQCPGAPHLSNGTVTCGDDPAPRFSYGNNCTFGCQDGFELRGAVSMACAHSGEWNAAPPTCEESASHSSAIVAGATIAGAVALSALSLLVWILRRRRREPADDLVMIMSDIEEPPAVQEGTGNPVPDRDVTADLNNGDHEIIPKAE